MKILIIGGLHGNEPLGIELVRAIERSPIKNVDAVLGNPEAVKKYVRFVDVDLNRVFPGKPVGNNEERQALELMRLIQGYNVVLDFHNTNTPNNDCGFVGGYNYKKILPIATSLGIDRVVVADYDCINKYVPTCLSVEVSLSSPENSVPHWIEKIKLLASGAQLPKKQPMLYQFVYRVTREMQDTLKFKWNAFEPILKEDASQLSLPPNTYLPIFVDDEYTPWNFAGLVRKINSDSLNGS
jgi:hypothetical protein